MTKRLFIAISLPESLADNLEDYQQNLASVMLRGEKINWTKKENLHLTVHFLGDVAIDKISQLFECLTEVAKSTAVFDLIFKEIIWAPPARQPRMIWATFHGHEQYQKLATEIYRATKDILFEIQEPKFLPHITLARFRYLSDRSRAGDNKLPAISPANIEVTSFSLFESQLYSDGPVYKQLDRFDISGC